MKNHSILFSIEKRPSILSICLILLWIIASIIILRNMRRMVFSSGHMHNVLAVILQSTSETSSNRGDSFSQLEEKWRPRVQS